MRRYWIEKKWIQASIVTFRDELFHHIFEVCRQEPGHHFEILTEDSNAYLVKVISREKKQATAEIIESRHIEKLPKPHIHLALSLSRYPVMDSVIEKAVEMGVSSVLPFFSDYSFIRSGSSLPAGKLERWRKIVLSATQQSGRGDLMPIAEPVDWPVMVKTINPGPANWCLFAYEGAGVLGVKAHLEGLKNSKAVPAENLWVVVGSEGGFSQSEAAEMRNLGLDPVTLGAQILRVETACMTLVSVLKYEFGLLR